jgi:hypothetical protein
MPLGMQTRLEEMAGIEDVASSSWELTEAGSCCDEKRLSVNDCVYTFLHLI